MYPLGSEYSLADSLYVGVCPDFRSRLDKTHWNACNFLHGNHPPAAMLRLLLSLFTSEWFLKVRIDLYGFCHVPLYKWFWPMSHSYRISRFCMGGVVSWCVRGLHVGSEFSSDVRHCLLSPVGGWVMGMCGLEYLCSYPKLITLPSEITCLYAPAI